MFGVLSHVSTSSALVLNLVQNAAQFCAQVMFGVLRHVSTSSALVLNLDQNAAQFRAHFDAQDFQCLLNRPPGTHREQSLMCIPRVSPNATFCPRRTRGLGV